MSEGQPGVNRLEEGHRHLNGEDAARSTKLHHKPNDRDSFTHIPKTGRERVDDIREDDRAEYACQQIKPEVLALNTHEEDVSDAEHDPLQDSDACEDAIATQVDLVRFHVFKTFEPALRGIHARERNEEDRTDPERERRIEGAHRVAVALHLVDGVLLKNGRGRQERSDGFRIVADDLADLIDVARADGCFKVISCFSEVALNRAKHVRGVIEGALKRFHVRREIARCA